MTTSASSKKGGDFGGAWYWNRYPGAHCDTASFIHVPLLEETGHMPTEKYAHAPEILEHCQHIGKHYGLYDDALFHTEVKHLEWDGSRSRWIIRTDRGDEMTAQFVVMGIGPLHVPKLGPTPTWPSPDCTPGYYNYEGQDPGSWGRPRVGFPWGRGPSSATWTGGGGPARSMAWKWR